MLDLRQCSSSPSSSNCEIELLSYSHSVCYDARPSFALSSIQVCYFELQSLKVQIWSMGSRFFLKQEINVFCTDLLGL